MPNPILPRRSFTASSVPLTTDAQVGELLINWADGKLFTKNSSGQIVTHTLGGSGGGGSSVTEIVEVAAASSLPGTGAAGKLYIVTDTSRVLRWDSSGVYIEMGTAGGGGGGSGTDLSQYFLPPAPTGLTATAGNAQVSLSWTAPSVSAQTPITDYVVEFKAASASTWDTFSDGTSTTTSATVTGLTNGTAYVFRVAAVNGVGTGTPTAASSSVTPTSFSPVAVVVASGSSYAAPAGATSVKAWAVGAGAVGGSQDSRYGGSGAVAFKTWAISGGQSISYSVPQGVAAGNWQGAASATTITFSGATVTANAAPSPYTTGTTARASFSGGDGGAQGALGGVSASDGRGLNNDAGRTPVEVSGLLAAVAQAVTAGNVPSGVTASTFGYGNLIANRSSAPPIGGGGQAGGGSNVGDPSNTGAVVFLFT